MGTTHVYVTVTVRNPANKERFWEGLFLVDTGAMDSLVPGNHLEAMGLEPMGKRTYELADGSEPDWRLDLRSSSSWAMQRPSTVIFGDDHAAPILGVTALESVGIEVDPRSQTLKRRPALHLKRMGLKESIAGEATHQIFDA
uniref:Clan AA aspartic protease, AF_0612 family n=1 Tax=Candidatus Kentrum sp. TUN TaxID=2126343 RepID=A0A450ZRA7_9GAMM|nr:MAG: clan AA aspartic protease, AF_0612 family [Candidatus Kentron sp. TUN]VFK56290.1 MAG: clan AA aspartic protease, AF_0612 family [Candidatus Kentron sp. TUN]VFK62366.1 MAG: clan AA aspartic protease, AF_0612 family [Candidatus Kentron sp. TUN]